MMLLIKCWWNTEEDGDEEGNFSDWDQLKIQWINDAYDSADNDDDADDGVANFDDGNDSESKDISYAVHVFVFVFVSVFVLETLVDHPGVNIQSQNSESSLIFTAIC